jgi:phage tail protein X
MDRYKEARLDPATPRKAYATIQLIDIPKSYDDRYIFSREGDRLDLLAYEFYGDTQLWPILASANNLGKGSLSVPAELQLRIPPNSIILELDNLLRKAEEDR